MPDINALAPGIEYTCTLFLNKKLINWFPGSDIRGEPESDINDIVWSDFNNLSM